MLSSLLGIRLILLIGNTVPVPAPYNLTTALTKVEVTNDAESGDGFQMTFTLGRDKLPEYSLLLSGLLNTFNRVIIGVLMGAVPEVLIDGIITHHQITPSNDPGMSTFTVTGKDVSIVLDLEERNSARPNQPDYLIVQQLILRYAQYGLVPETMPTADIPISVERTPQQHETDLKYIQRLAQNNGYVFYVEPVTFGVNIAHWGSKSRVGIPQPALTFNMGAATNVKSINFSLDAMAPVTTSGDIVEPITRISIPLPALPPLRVPPLAAMPTPARRRTIARDTANENPAAAATSIVAAETNTPDAVTGDGELDAVHYGRVLRARGLVGVRGVGYSYDGLYYVKSVTHSIAKGEYTQKFSLSREGTGALTPVVIP
jgi:hypothetical protein